ncbi:hypothetical protein [Nonomuraea jabiensis]|uniref:hypothetical protein n=1 Tax=Nonomuraea jabiensis TaxID=882448 RepID=UPI0036CBAD0B
MHDLPPKSATCYYSSEWRDDGTDKAIHDLLRWHPRERKKRSADPSLVVPDTQSVHVAAGVPASTTGQDAAKRVPGRKHGLAVDVLGHRRGHASGLCGTTRYVGVPAAIATAAKVFKTRPDMRILSHSSSQRVASRFLGRSSMIRRLQH